MITWITFLDDALKIKTLKPQKQMKELQPVAFKDNIDEVKLDLQKA